MRRVEAAPILRAWGLAVLLVHQGAAAAGAQSLELLASSAGVDFDGSRIAGLEVSAPGAVLAASSRPPESALSVALSNTRVLLAAAGGDPPPQAQGIWGPGDVPRGAGFPIGLGPISRERRPGYLKGLLGSLFTLIAAPFALALELIQAVALTPVRMARGLARGDWLSLLEPVRTVKNLVQDAVLTAAGMLNAAAGPVWNAIRPDHATDFQYANNRLIFRGGPVGAIHDALGWGAFAPSWHTVFLTGAGAGSRVFEHEFVHNRQWSRSFLWEKVCEDYRGCKSFRRQDAHEYLNW